MDGGFREPPAERSAASASVAGDDPGDQCLDPEPPDPRDVTPNSPLRLIAWEILMELSALREELLLALAAR